MIIPCSYNLVEKDKGSSSQISIKNTICFNTKLLKDIGISSNLYQMGADKSFPSWISAVRRKGISSFDKKKIRFQNVNYVKRDYQFKMNAS